MDPNSPSQYPPSAPPPYGAPAGADPKVRNLAIGLFVLALLLMIGTFTKSWTSRSEGGMSIGTGLLGMEASFGDKSKSASWGEGKDGPADLQFLGYVGLLAGLATVAAAVASGVFAMTNKPNPIPPKAMLGLAGATAGVMVIFLIRLMTHKDLDKMDLGISYSGILAIIGAAGISVVGKMLYEARGQSV